MTWIDPAPDHARIARKLPSDLPAPLRSTRSISRCSADNPRIVGENGAGKSTLTKIVTGAMRQIAGSSEFAAKMCFSRHHVTPLRPASPHSLKR